MVTGGGRGRKDGHALVVRQRVSMEEERGAGAPLRGEAETCTCTAVHVAWRAHRVTQTDGHTFIIGRSAHSTDMDRSGADSHEACTTNQHLHWRMYGNGPCLNHTIAMVVVCLFCIALFDRNTQIAYDSCVAPDPLVR